MVQIIKPFDNGWNYILDLSFKLILLLVIWSWKCNNVLKEKFTSLGTSVIRVCWSALNVISQWISKPWIQKHKDHSKTSNGAGRFAHILLACKVSRYNVHNCKAGKHNRGHTFRRHNTWYKPSLTIIPYCGLKVKEKKNGKTKNPSPCWQNWMHRDLNLCQDVGNDHLLTHSRYNNHSCINFSFHQNLNQVYSSTDLLDKVVLIEVVTRPSKKNMECKPAQIDTKEK